MGVSHRPGIQTQWKGPQAESPGDGASWSEWVGFVLSFFRTSPVQSSWPVKYDESVFVFQSGWSVGLCLTFTWKSCWASWRRAWRRRVTCSSTWSGLRTCSCCTDRSWRTGQDRRKVQVYWNILVLSVWNDWSGFSGPAPSCPPCRHCRRASRDTSTICPNCTSQLCGKLDEFQRLVYNFFISVVCGGHLEQGWIQKLSFVNVHSMIISWKFHQNLMLFMKYFC